MVRRSLMTLGLGALAGLALGQAPVSVFDFNGTLNARIANNVHVGPMDYRSGGTPTADAGDPTYSMQTVGATNKLVAHFTANNLFRSLHGVGKNGGGSYANVYTLLLDVNFTETSSGWASLWNTNDDNFNDGEGYIQWGTGIGINGTYAGSISANTWNRIVVTVSTNGVGTNLGFYVNGALANGMATGDTTDGRFSMYTWDDPDVGFDAADVLAEPAGYHSGGMVSQVAWYDYALSAEQVANLGTVGSPVPEPATLAMLGIGVLALRRRKK